MTTTMFRFVGKIKFLLLTLSMLITGASCNKQLDVNSSRQANEEGHWTKYEDARSGLIGMYGLFRAAIASNNAHWLLGELRNGDFSSTFRPDLKAVIEGNLNASFPVIQDITNWRRYYAAINACNLFIERVNGCLADKRYTDTYLRLDIAQARTLRAFIYFYMVRIWGDVPLITKSHDGSFEALPRTSQDLVLSFAERELIEAAPKLPFLYSGTDPEQLYPANYYGFNQSNWANAPLNRLAAYALLAHIAAWQGRYVDVEVYTKFILDNYNLSAPGQASVVSTSTLVSPTGLFFANSGNYRQLIGFSFIANRGETTTEGHIEQLTLAKTTNFPMSKPLPDIYIAKDLFTQIFPRANGNDDRYGVDIRFTPALPYTTYFENQNAEIPVFKKVRILDGGIGDGSFAVFNSSIVFTRLEEIKLLRAEALAVIGNSTEALLNLNEIKTARKINTIGSSISSSNLLSEIFAERRRELMGEGWRWYDLIRYNRLTRNDPAFNELLDRGGIYWPIAQDVLNRNAKIVQNTYWQ